MTLRAPRYLISHDFVAKNNSKKENSQGNLNFLIIIKLSKRNPATAPARPSSLRRLAAKKGPVMIVVATIC
jgi:hypothetical protein